MAAPEALCDGPSPQLDRLNPYAAGAQFMHLGHGSRALLVDRLHSVDTNALQILSFLSMGGPA